jgi:hypothetical protein
MELFDLSPESYSTVALNLNTNGMLDYPNAPLLLQIWTLTQNFVLKISCEFILRHALGFSIFLSRISTAIRLPKPNARINPPHDAAIQPTSRATIFMKAMLRAIGLNELLDAAWVKPIFTR